MREKIIKSLIAHAKGHIEKHKANVEILLQKIAGVAEHPDMITTIDGELEKLATAQDKLNTLSELK